MSLDQNESVHRNVLALEALGGNLFLPLLDAGGILMVSAAIPLCVWNSSSTSSLIRTLVIPFSTHSHNLGWSSHLRIVNHADRDHLS